MNLPERTLVISATGVSFTAAPDGTPDVLVHLDIAENSIGLAPGLGLALRLSPQEARMIADTLRSQADEAEAVFPSRRRYSL